MRKLTTLFLILYCTSAFGQYFAPNQKPPLGFQVNGGHPLSKGLVGLWLFNEGSGSQVFDLSGYGNNGTFDATNPPAWKAGKFGSCVDINTSATQPISLPSSIVLTQGTIAGRIYWSGNAEKMWIGDDTTSNYFFYVGHWRVKGATTKIDFSDSLPAAGWYYVVLVMDGTNWNLYVDDVPDSGNPIASSQTYTINTIGHSYSSSTYCWDGDIDNAMIWNRALSASEIAQLYSNSFCFMEPNWNWNFYIPFLAAPTVGAPQVIIVN